MHEEFLGSYEFLKACVRWRRKTQTAMVRFLLELVSLLLNILIVFGPVFSTAQREGFIGIDCGSPEGTSYIDEVTGIKYVSDEAYIFTGENRDVSRTTNLTGNAKLYKNARIFPVGDRNCYNLRPVKKGNRYLIRAHYLYDDYDGIEQIPEFEIYVGVNLWMTSHFAAKGKPWFYEIITVAMNDFIDVCLVRKENSGNPCISGLELKPLEAETYKAATEVQDLFNCQRFAIGGPDDKTYRYKDDPFDRFWWPWNLTNAVNLKGTAIDPSQDKNVYHLPQEIMRYAMEPINYTQPLTHSWALANAWNQRFFFYAHMGEVDPSRANKLREFRACIQDTDICFGTFRTNNMSTLTLTSESTLVTGKEIYVLSLQRTARSELPPILNAFEVYVGLYRNVIPTFEGDVNAIMEVRDFHGIKKNWMGDPCVPETYMWEGLTCKSTAHIAQAPRIIRVNLSSSGLHGSISPSIGHLSSLESLDLSENGLSGEVPDFLANLTSLTFLDLSGNYFLGIVPRNLLQRTQSGLLQLRVEGNPDLCKSRSCFSSNKKRKLRILIAVLVTAAALVSCLILCLCLLRKFKTIFGKQSVAETNNVEKSRPKAASSSSFPVHNRRFTYEELRDMTNNFRHVLGRGGFGTVYKGFLKDGNQVAVKVITNNCTGSTDFQTEAQLLTRISHKNLVQFYGYCADGNNKAIVLEYMEKGNLAEVLLNSKNNTTILNWSQRLRIAQDIAHGLEYLHVGCKPPIIHRDVKLTNILLNNKLEAKITDFGISKVFYNHEDCSFASTTEIKGTLGYLDPEYYKMKKLNEKSDVYGFGIILLQLITGKPAIIEVINASNDERISIIQWVRNKVSHGDLRSILDPKIGGYDINSAWAAIEVAMESSKAKSLERPSMSEVVNQLKECITGVEKASLREVISSALVGSENDSLYFPTPR